MVLNEQRITIIMVRKGRNRDINEKIKWIGHSLGLFGIRDKDSSCYRLFVELLKSSRTSEPLPSDEFAYRLGLTRATVIHHMNKLIESGIVVSQHNKYILRVNRLEQLIEELRKDMRRAMDELADTAKQVDEEMKL